MNTKLNKRFVAEDAMYSSEAKHYRLLSKQI